MEGGAFIPELTPEVQTKLVVVKILSVLKRVSRTHPLCAKQLCNFHRHDKAFRIK